MAQTASGSSKQPPRISQLLPTVKCSSCLQPVPLAELGDHVCPPQPPPTLLSLQKPPMSPKSTNSLLPQRLQNILVSNMSGSPAQQQSVTSRTPPPHAHPPRSSQHDPFQRIPPSVHYNPGATRINSPASPPIPQSILLNRGTSINKPHVRFPTQSAPERVTTPIRIATPPVPTRTRTPSNNGSPSSRSPLGVTSFPNPFEDDTRQLDASEPVVGRSSSTSLARRENVPVLSQAPLPSSRTRTPSNAPSHTSIIPPSLTPRPSFDRSRTPSTLAPRPSLEKPRPSFDSHTRPSFDAQRPSFDASRPHHPTDVRPQPVAVPRPPRSTSALPSSGGVPFPLSTSAPQPPSVTRSPVPDSERNIDTKCGGVAGMAGVGRRGFAAVARAAMVAASHPHPGPSRHGDASLMMDGRRPNAPKYLDLNTTMNHVMRAAMTPPLSPNSGHSHSPVSPHPSSPLSSLHNTTPTTGQFPKTPLTPHDKTGVQFLSSSPNQKVAPLSSSPADIHIVTPSRSPSPISNPFSRHLSGETVNQSPFAAVPVRLPFLDAFDKGPVNHSCDDSDDESVYTTHTAEPRRGHRSGKEPMSPSTDSEVGLAYADDSDNDTPVVMPLDIRKSNTVSGINKVQFPSIEDRHQSSTVRKSPSRNASASSAPTASASRTIDASPSRTRSASAATHTTTRSNGALERAMETLIEEGASVSVLASGSVLASMAGPSGSRASGKPNRSNTVPGLSPESRPPKLPARSHTSPHHPHIHSEPVGITGQVVRVRERSKAKKDRICASCDMKVDDGRWIQMDGGNILCERCWKNMYLPKCRRCNLPIEKQAVSSSDGQLKGKYHRDCFNCHICQKPFPDKEFYVFDGKPLCAYHYHEANDSLCAAVSCGEPIEGPCAVTHGGKRYHPDHLLCEFENGCGEQLAEYWEVDGQMLCEKHAALAGGSSCASSRGDSPDPQRIRDEGRARRRMTRFIDLGAVEEEDVDIR